MTPDVLTPHQRAVAERVLAEEGARRRHLVVSLSGAHAYGFPSPDSDLDLKAVHREPSSRLLGLSPPAPSVDRLEVVDGVEVDYTSNELHGLVNGLLLGNGNYLERVLGPLLLVSSPEREELASLARGSLSRRVHRHYRGFALNQLREVERTGTPPAKRVLYVLRTAVTGTHLLRSGEVVADLSLLCDEYGLSDARRLIEAKRAGEKTPLSTAERDAWLKRIGAVLEGLDAAARSSPLPAEPPNAAALEAWLLEQRHAHFLPE